MAKKRSHYKKQKEHVRKTGKVSHNFPKNFRDVKPIDWRPEQRIFVDHIVVDELGGETTELRQANANPKTLFTPSLNQIFHRTISDDGNFVIFIPADLPNPDDIVPISDDMENYIVNLFNYIGHTQDDLVSTQYLSALVKGVLLNEYPQTWDTTFFDPDTGEEATMPYNSSVLDKYELWKVMEADQDDDSSILLNELYQETMDLITTKDGTYIHQITDLESKTIEEEHKRHGTYATSNFIGVEDMLEGENLFIDTIKVLQNVRAMDRLLKIKNAINVPAEVVEETMKKEVDRVNEEENELTEKVAKLKIIGIERRIHEKNTGEKVLTRENITAQRIFDTNDRVLTRENITAQRIFEPVEVDVVSELEKALATLTKEKAVEKDEPVIIKTEIIIPNEIIEDMISSDETEDLVKDIEKDEISPLEKIFGTNEIIERVIKPRKVKEVER